MKNFFRGRARTDWVTLCLVLSLAVGAGVTVRPASGAADELPEIIKRVEPSIVVVLTYDRAGKLLGQGTGFFINNEGDVITNHHVLAEASQANIKTDDGKIYSVKKILDDDKIGDLVRISVDIPKDLARSLTVTPSFPEVGERIIVIGTPLGLEKTVSDGIVSAVREIPGFGAIVQITAPISPGSSGSPVVNMKGEVIGIATFFLIAGQNLNFAIPGYRIVKLTAGEGKTLAEWEGVSRGEKTALAQQLYWRGFRRLLAADWENAILFFLEAIKNNPNLGEAFFQTGYSMAKLGRYAESIELYTKALRLTPDDVDIHNNLCVAFNMLGRYDDAIEICKRAVQIKPDLAEPFSNLGWTYQKLGRFTEGIESSKQAIRLKPDYATAHYNLGNNYSGLARNEEAIESYKQAIRLRPDYAEGHLNLGASYIRLGRYPEAIDSYKQAARIKPALSEAHLNLGMAYLRIGDRSSALDEYKILKGQDQNMANKLFNLIYD